MKRDEQKLIEKTKKISVKEGCGWGIMEGFGVRYITPFALAIGANNAQVGLLSSVPSLIGNLSELGTIKAMNKYPRKKIIFFGAILQAIMWLFLIGIGALVFVLGIKNSLPAYSLILVYTLLVVFGAIISPAWISWMKDIVTHNLGDYFGKRSKKINIVIFTSILIASFVLDYFKQTKLFLGFIILFSLAFAGRAISAFLMLKQYEPKLKPDKKAYFSLIQFIKKMRENNFGRFVIYMSLVSLTVNIASPFFAVYMLKQLHFSYIEFMIVLLSSSIASFMLMPLWGRFSDKHGNIRTMNITGFLTTLIPFLWLLSAVLMHSETNKILYFLILAEILSGMVWAGFNLASSNFIYDAVSRQRVAICVTYFHIINSVGVLIGAGLGGLISSQSFTIIGLNSLLFVFLLSGIGRMIVYFTLNKKIKEVRIVRGFNIKKYTKEKIIHVTRLLYHFEKSKMGGR